MGSDETAITIPGGPRVIDVFDGNGAPSGPNYLLFSGADRHLDSLRDRSGVGWWPTPHAPVLGALQRAFFFFSVLDLTVENNPRSLGGKKTSGRCTLRACLAGPSGPTRPDIPTRSCRRLPVIAGLTTRPVCPQAPSDFAPPTHRT